MSQHSEISSSTDHVTMTPQEQQAANDQLSELRLQGLGLNGENRYKQDLIACITGALGFGAQGATPPPDGHWLSPFYQIGKEERAARRRAEAERDEALQELAALRKSDAPTDPEAAVSPTAAIEDAYALAARLDGAQYPFTPHKDLVAMAKAAGLVIVYGASDDLVEFDGAFRDEVSRYDGGTVLVDSKGVLDHDQVDDDDDEAIAAYLTRKANCRQIEALWGQNGYDWSYETDIPHATFMIKEGAELYCSGIVFAVADLAPEASA